MQSHANGDTSIKLEMYFGQIKLLIKPSSHASILDGGHFSRWQPFPDCKYNVYQFVSLNEEKTKISSSCLHMNLAT